MGLSFLICCLSPESACFSAPSTSILMYVTASPCSRLSIFNARTLRLCALINVDCLPPLSENQVPCLHPKLRLQQAVHFLTLLFLRTVCGNCAGLLPPPLFFIAAAGKLQKLPHRIAVISAQIQITFFFAKSKKLR